MLKLSPYCRSALWGGTRLHDEFGLNCEGDNLAEAWMLSCENGKSSIITNGMYAEKTMADYIAAEGNRVLGSHCAALSHFPLLVKYIDARESLSIQVHPNDEYSTKHEGQWGKTEMWYILDAEPESYLFIGPEHTISKEEFSKSIEDYSLPDLLHKQYVKPGDAYLIPAGTIHAIGKGILLAEIQQSSDVTYRIYDYDRRDNRGRPRELHIPKACDVVNLTPVCQTNDFRGHLICCQYFTVDEKIGCTQGYCGKESFIVVLPISGSGTIASESETFQMECGSCFFLPADSGEYSVAGNCKYLIASV